MLDFIGNAFGAIASGGLTGLIGAGLSLFGELKKQKLANEHEARMAEIEQQGMKLEAELNMRVVETEAEAAVNIEESKAFAASYGNDRRTYATGRLGAFGQALMVIVDFIRGLVRPSVTIYMAVIVTLMYSQILELVGGLDGALDKATAVELLNQIILVILYVAATVILWWFGVRFRGAKG